MKKKKKVRFIYFISTLFEFGEKLTQMTFVCFDFGSTFFYSTFIFFFLYWSEILIISGGKHVNIMKREMVFHRSSMHLMIILIHLIQIGISTFRVLYGIPKNIFDFPEFVQVRKRSKIDLIFKVFISYFTLFYSLFRFLCFFKSSQRKYLEF